MKFFIAVLLSLFIIQNYHSQRFCGTNLAWNRYWAPQIIFKDLFKQSSPWLTRDSSSTSPWNTNTLIPTNNNGYPLSVPFGNPPQLVHNLIFNGAGGNYPAGEYQIIADGIGTIELEWDSGDQIFSNPINNSFNVNPSNQGIHLTITYSDVSDPIRNIRIIMPGFIDNYEIQPFYPPIINFIDSSNVFQAIRFMDLMNTNNSTISSWNQRTSKENYTQAGNLNAGMNYDYMIDLCNYTSKDMWISIPHEADDNYIQEFANLINLNLNSNLKVYVEYSNEAWNNIFTQNSYCNTQGAALGFLGQPWEQGWTFYAKRSAEIHSIFEQTIGNDRLVKVVSSQAGNSYIANYILSKYNDQTINVTGVEADALAIAPYFGNNLADSIGDAGAISQISVENLLNLMHARINNQVLPQITSNKSVADNYNLDLIAYEGGTHVVAVNNTYFNNTELTEKIIAANNDPFMETIYCDYFDAWYENGGSLFMNFTGPAFSNGQWSSLSIINNMNQPLIDSPKWRAMKNCASDTSIVLTISLDESEFINFYPNPTQNIVNLKTNKTINHLKILNFQGKIFFEQETPDEFLNVDFLEQGIYIIEVQFENNQKLKRKLVKI